MVPLKEWGIYMIQQLGVGGVLGALAGYAVKKVAKVVAVLLGLLFVIVQLLAFHKMITINWGNIAHALQPHMTASGAGHAATSLWKVLLYNVPFGAAFGFGFYFGLKKG